MYYFLRAGGASGPGQSDGRQDLHHHSSSAGDNKKRGRDLRPGEGDRRGDGHPRRPDRGGWPLRPPSRPPRGRDGVDEEESPQASPSRRSTPQEARNGSTPRQADAEQMILFPLDSVDRERRGALVTGLSYIFTRTDMLPSPSLSRFLPQFYHRYSVQRYSLSPVLFNRVFLRFSPPPLARLPLERKEEEDLSQRTRIINSNLVDTILLRSYLGRLFFHGACYSP